MREDLIEVQKAADLLSVAVSAHYVYPPEFPGFSADLHSHSRRGCVRGAVLYSAPISLEFFPETRGGTPSPPAVASAAVKEVDEIVSEMWSGGRPALALGSPIVYGENENSVGVLLSVPDDPTDTQYRVRGGRVQQIAWMEGHERVAVTTLEVIQADADSILPHVRMVSRTSESDGRLIATSSIVDTYQYVAGFPVPRERRVFVSTDDGGVYDREIHFSHPTLLSVPDVWRDRE